MKIKFNSKLSYQLEAVSSVVNLFKGQSIMPSKFSFSKPNRLDYVEGTGNTFNISFNDIEENFKNVQNNNDLEINKNLNSLDFTIEMETGTGKTYVFLKTILELYKHYGFSKYVIVVPSIAIKEGVKKNINITSKHFEEEYNVNIKESSFVFDSNNLTRLERFADTDSLQIMVITVQSFINDRNKINKRGENGIIPMEHITSTNPIVVIDEPQTTLSSDTRKEAIADLNPLFTLQYSATPKDAKNLVYRLDAVDAYNKNLVKKIVVNAFDSADYQGKPYMQLNSTNLNKRTGKRTAKIYLIYNTKTGYKKQLSTSLKIWDKLSIPKITNNNAYDNYQIEDIIVTENNEHVLFTNGEKLYLNQIKNDINQECIRKAQIEETIREHLKKELYFNKNGMNIKVLSLFFIDSVPNYRYYDDEGAHNGKYAKWFEESYERIIQEDIFQKLPEYIKKIPSTEVHNGYFSIDKTKSKKAGVDVFIESEEYKSGKNKGEIKNGEDTFSLIMRDKEELLKLDNPLRFIFSHSALKEGWDNPNVFQICTLIETKSDMSKRQKIGRGLRLCIDNEGNRIDEIYGEEFKTINRLTVLANESFENFADSLQKEMEADGIIFTKITKKDFKGIIFINDIGKESKISDYDANKILRCLSEQNILKGQNNNFKITKQGYNKLVEGDFELPSNYISIKDEIAQIITDKSPTQIITKKEDEELVSLNEDKLRDPNFVNLWDKIKYRTKYSVSIDSEKLINKCIEDMKDPIKKIKKIQVTHTITDVSMKNRISGKTRHERPQNVNPRNDNIQDIVRDLQDKTHLTKDTIIKILIGSNEKDNTFEKLLINPTEYFNKTLEIIMDNLYEMCVDKIEYHIVEGKEHPLSIFRPDFFISLKDDEFDENKIVETTKSLYNYIECDSKTVEVPFAKELELKEDIKFFIKLPRKFEINTPLGINYNPDWAITVEVEGKEQTYFVIETKKNHSAKDRRGFENAKIKCGEKHFEVLPAVDYDVCVDYRDFSSKYLHEN